MAVPSSYADLGKSARDLFEKGFNYGFAKLDVKTKTGNGIEFTTKGSSCNDTGKIDASLETKYKKSIHGLTFTEKWTTENNLSTEVAFEDQIASGVKITLCTSFSPNTGEKNGSLKTAYKRDYINMNLDSDFNLTGPKLKGAAVIGYEGWLAGYQFGFDTANKTLTKNNVALGYNGADFQLLFNVNDASEFGGSIYQSIGSNLSTGVQLSWTAGQNNTRFGLAAKYAVDNEASVLAKVNNVGQVGVGYTQSISENVKLTSSALIDAKNFNAGGHSSASASNSRFTPDFLSVYLVRLLN